MSRNRIARLHANGKPDVGFNPGTGANNSIHSIALQPDGKMLIAGSFTTYNATARNYIARLNADGTLDISFNPGSGANGTVLLVVPQPDGKMIIGGGFTSFNGTARNNIARLNADGTLDAGFNPGTGANAAVRTMALQPDGKVLIGGSFASYNGTARNNIARLNANGTLDAGFNPGVGTNGTLRSIVLQPDGKMMIGGNFTSYNGTARNCIARLNADGSLDAGFNPGTGANTEVWSIALQPDGKIMIGGAFTTYNGNSRNYVARLNADGTLDAGFNPGTGANSNVLCLALQTDWKVLVGGIFTSYNGTGRNRIARSNGDTEFISSFVPSGGGSGAAITITGTNFTGATAVGFGGTPAASFTVESANTITAVVAGGSSGAVTVSRPGGTLSSVGFTYFLPPAISSFTPIIASMGATVTITGTNFVGATAVSFGGVTAESFSVVNSTTITAVLAGGSSGTVSVTTPGGTASQPGFSFIPPPVISSFTPTTSAFDSMITITGTNFTGATTVGFGGQLAAGFTVVNATTITAIVPAFAASGNVTVTTPGGTASKPGFTFVPAPVISSFTPAGEQQGNSVAITGSNFTGASAVSFGGIASGSFTVNSSTSITAVVGAGASGSVSVTTPGGIASKAGFTFIIPAPVITAISPTMGGSGTTVTISGSNFNNAGAVSFGGTPAASFIVNNSGSISATPGSGSTGAVSVTTPGGSHSFGNFSFYPVPVISGFNPASGKAGDSITISGNHLNGTNAVSFGAVPAAGFRLINNSSVKACLAAGASGMVTLSTPGGTANLAGFTFSGPSISGFSPSVAAEGDTVTISGTNFSGVSAILFGGYSALSFSVINTTMIKAVVADGASGKVEAIVGTDTASKTGFVFIAPPAIYSFNPTNASPGASIFIKGQHFSNTSSVLIGGVAAMNFVVLNDSTIEAKAGAQASQGKVTVNTAGGSATLAGFVFEPGACIGGTVYIASNINGANYQWQVNSGQGFTDISNGGNYDFAQTAVLRISNLPASWAGYNYRCRVGGTYSTSFDLHIFNQWNGSQNDAWENAANWQCGLVPDSNSEVIIKAGIVKINSDVRVKSLKLESDASVNIASGRKLYIAGRQAMPVRIDKVEMAAGHYLLHPKTPGLMMKPGESATLVVRKFGNDAADSIPQGLAFSSSQQTVAMVNAAGLVQALQPGFSLVEATDATGKKAYVSVQVLASNAVPVTSEPIFAGFSRPLYTINSDIGAYIPVTALNRLGAPLNLPVTLVVTASGYQKEFAGSSLVNTPEGGFALGARTGAVPLIGESAMLGLSANQSQGFSSAFLSASPGNVTQPGSGMQQSNAYSTPPPGLPQIFHVSLPFGIYPVIFTNKGLTSEPVWGNVYRLISYPIMFGEFWTGAYGITILVLSEEVPVETEAGVVASASGSRLVSKKPGIEKWRVVPENFIGPWNKCQVFADYSGDWCSNSDTYGRSIKMRIPKAPDVIFYEGPLSMAYNWLTGNYSQYYKNFTGPYAPGYAQLTDGQAQFRDVATEVAFPKSKVEIGPYRELGTGLGFFNADRTRPLQKGDVFAGLYFQYINRTGRLKWVNANEFDFELFKPVDSSYSSWFTGGPFKRCSVVFAPQITDFSPGSGGPGTVVTITGSDFTGATGVTFGGIAAASFTVINDHTISAVLSPAGKTGKIRITTPGGACLSALSFTFIFPAPSITSFDPNTGTVGSVIKIYGTNLAGTYQVEIGGATVSSFQVISDNLIEAIVGDDAESGDITVWTEGGVASKDGFTFFEPTPEITSFEPTSAYQGMTVKVTGRNLSRISWVEFGGVAANSFSIENAETIYATVGAGASGDISVYSNTKSASMPGFVFKDFPTKKNTGGNIYKYVQNDGSLQEEFSGFEVTSRIKVNYSYLQPTYGAEFFGMYKSYESLWMFIYVHLDEIPTTSKTINTGQGALVSILYSNSPIFDFSSIYASLPIASGTPLQATVVNGGEEITLQMTDGVVMTGGTYTHPVGKLTITLKRQ